MAISPERKEYIYQYAKEKLKRIPLDVPKATYEEIKAHAEARGKSVNGFIKHAISETMARDGSGGPQEAAGLPEGGGGIPVSPGTLEAAQRAAEAAGETLPVFVERAVSETAERDRLSRDS